MPEGADTRAGRARRFIARARLILWWERVWPALWPALGFVGAYAILALFGILPVLPGGVQVLVVLVLMGVTAYYLWRRFSTVHAPEWSEAARRLERDSRLEHRPITEADDTIAAGRGDPVSEGLWRAHMMALFARAKRLRLGLPHPGMGRGDRYYLRFVVLAGVVAGVVFAGGDWWHRLTEGFAPVVGGRTQAVVTAWVAPPAYTGRAPLSLDAAKPSSPSVPQHSVMAIRITGTESAPTLHIRPTPHANIDFARIAAGYEAHIRLESDADVAVMLGVHTLGEWKFTVEPDHAPAIAFTEPPASSAHQALKFSYRATDDYGVVKIEAHITPVDPLVKGATNARELIVPLSAPASEKAVTETVYRDLTAHAFAGLKVSIVLVATDASGQTGASKPVVMTLPERIFTKPLAKALVEQRKSLALGLPNALERATLIIDALTIAPELYYKDDYSTYLAMRSLFYELRNVKDTDDVHKAMAMMWDIAVSIEDGDLSDAAQALRQAQQDLMSALERNAPDSEIDALLQKLREAMARYLQAMAQNVPQNQPQQQGNAQTISPQDLAQILKAIQDLARTGARDQARAMLQALSQLLENLHMSGPPTPGQSAMTDALRGLSDLLGNQRQLLDRTFRAERGQGPQQGLAPDQKTLHDQLGKVMQGLEEHSQNVPQALGRAGQSMQQSEQGLGGGQLGSAEQAQQNAIEQLREGAQALAKDLMAQGGQQGGQNGAAGAGEDPLGRPTGAQGTILGGSVRVPNQSELERARQILDELRKRAGENSRSREELDYIERLLKQF